MSHSSECILVLRLINPEEFEKVMRDAIELADGVVEPSVADEMKNCESEYDWDDPLFSMEMSQIDMVVVTELGGNILVRGLQGNIFYGGQQMPICEIELKSICGKKAAFYKFAALLSENNALHLEMRSLYERGMIMASQPSLPNNEQSGVKLDQNNPANEELRKVLINYLGQIAQMEGQYLSKPEDPENLHHLRVKIRQLRSLLSLASPLFIQDAYQMRLDSARKYGQIFARMRELDVLQAEWIHIHGKELTLIDNEREKEKRLIHSALSKGVPTPILLNIWAWLYEENCFIKESEKMKLNQFLKRRLRRWLRNIRSDYETFADMDQRAIHALRIRCKKMRYVLECFNGKLTSHNTNRRIIELKEMQDKLGILCDSKRNIVLIDTITEHERIKGLNGETSFFKGYQACKYEMLREHLAKSNPNKSFLS